MIRMTKLAPRMALALPAGGVAAWMLACIAAPGAMAQPVTGPYVSLGGGGNLLQDEQLRLNENFPGSKLRFDAGEVGAGAVGYGFGNGFRVELEGNYRRENDLQHLLGTNFPTAAGGNQQNYGAMGNAFFDMDVGANWIYPYFGLGAGYSWTHWDPLRATGTAGNYDFEAGGTKGHYAYQAIFGLAFPVPYVPACRSRQNTGSSAWWGRRRSPARPWVRKAPMGRVDSGSRAATWIRARIITMRR